MRGAPVYYWTPGRNYHCPAGHNHRFPGWLPWWLIERLVQCR